MLTDTKVLDYEWKWETVGTNNPRIAKLKKELVSPEFKIRILGNSKQDMMDKVEYLTSVFDRDVYLGQMGRLYIGEFYRECFITSSTKQKIFEKTSTTIEFVATSDNADWVKNSTATFSGTGLLMGEIASSALVTANYRAQEIELTPNDDRTVGVKWNPLTYDGNNKLWIKFDFGNIVSIESFSGLRIKRSTGVSTPVQVDIEIGDGETIDDVRQKTVTTNTESSPVRVMDDTSITIDEYGGQVLFFIGYNGLVEIDRRQVEVGDTIELDAYDSYTFLTTSPPIEPTYQTTVDYTAKTEEWETVEEISLNQGSSKEVVIENVECRYVRFKGSYFGGTNDGINNTLSVVSNDIVPNKDILDLQYSTQNIREYTRDTERVSINREDSGRPGYINFSDTGLTLKRVKCSHITGQAILQKQTGDTWSDVVEITNNMNITYSTDVDKLRLQVLSNTILDGLKIEVSTDAKLYNDGYAPSNAIIELKGARNNPYIIIDDVMYGAKIDLLANHRLVIDTKNKTVRDYSDEYTFENVFRARYEDTFTFIDKGEHLVTWAGNYDEVKITLEQARSEPKWN